MKASGADARLLLFDTTCRGCLQRIMAREDFAIEVLSDDGYHRGWAHEECDEDLARDEAAEEER